MKRKKNNTKTYRKESRKYNHRRGLLEVANISKKANTEAEIIKKEEKRENNSTKN